LVYPEVLVPFLQVAPLFENEWLDRNVAELT
jgi:hypothetical protein